MTPRWVVCGGGREAGGAGWPCRWRRRWRRWWRLARAGVHSKPLFSPVPPLQCLQYKTDQQADLKKIEKLNRVFFALMATGAPPPPGARSPARRRCGSTGRWRQQSKLHTLAMCDTASIAYCVHSPPALSDCHFKPSEYGHPSSGPHPPTCCR